MPLVMDEDLMNVQQLAKLLGVSQSWVYYQVRRGYLPHVRVGKHTRFVPTDIAAWVEKQRGGPAA